MHASIHDYALYKWDHRTHTHMHTYMCIWISHTHTYTSRHGHKHHTFFNTHANMHTPEYEFTWSKAYVLTHMHTYMHIQPKKKCAIDQSCSYIAINMRLHWRIGTIIITDWSWVRWRDYGLCLALLCRSGFVAFGVYVDAVHHAHLCIRLRTSGSQWPPFSIRPTEFVSPSCICPTRIPVLGQYARISKPSKFVMKYANGCKTEAMQYQLHLCDRMDLFVLT